jgi:quercetin dioxygenase-like cupin family protein
MTDTSTHPFFRAKGEGKSIWFLGGLMTVKASGPETGGALAVLENLLPPGFATPLHVHRDADEPYYVLEGEVTFYCAGEAYRAGPGSFLFLPRGIPHAFRVSEAGPARLLILTLPGGFEDFVEDAGTPARQPKLPPATPIDLSAFPETAARHGIDILGPPPE